MTCEELLRLINEMVDGELDLTVAECRQFAEHLAQCNPCQVVVDNIRKTIQLYRAGEPFPLPEPLQRRLLEALRRRWQERFGSITVGQADN
ncbi:MAG: zf-HC2 domain-containing protein [Gemmatales bacterium]|nr:zf-HC2 domain-containing protein [Gemmatales bacterium]MDW7995094.1 zf-HC2 domain-containing protein [Gemmatales bacterium]